MHPAKLTRLCPTNLDLMSWCLTNSRSIKSSLRILKNSHSDPHFVCDSRVVFSTGGPRVRTRAMDCGSAVRLRTLASLRATRGVSSKDVESRDSTSPMLQTYRKVYNAASFYESIDPTDWRVLRPSFSGPQKSRFLGPPHASIDFFAACYSSTFVTQHTSTHFNSIQCHQSRLGRQKWSKNDVFGPHQKMGQKHTFCSTSKNDVFSALQHTQHTFNTSKKSSKTGSKKVIQKKHGFFTF